MDDFFFFLKTRVRKRKRAFFHEGLLEGATHFMEEENDQDIINDVARVVGVLGNKNRKPRGPTFFFFFFFFLFIILRRYKFLIYKFTNSTMNLNSYTN